MKKQVLSFLFGIALAMGFGFKPGGYEADYSTAEVQQFDGFYIYTDCKPVLPYDSVAIVEPGFITGTQYETIRDNIVKRAAKKYRNADGIIFRYNKKGIDKGLVIKFRQKEK